MSASSFEISEVDIRRFAAAIAHTWKRMADVIRLLDQGQDWNTFFKVCNCFTLMMTSNSVIYGMQ